MTQNIQADHPSTHLQNHSADSSLPARSALDCGRSATALPTSTPPPTANAPSEQPPAFARRVAQAGVGLCAFAVDVASASPPLTSSSLPSSEAKGGPFTGRRISPRFLSESPRTLTAAPVATHLIISNRSTRRLEMPETYTKQRTDPLSNRHKFTQRVVTSAPLWSPQYDFAHAANRPLHVLVCDSLSATLRRATTMKLS